MDAKGVADTRAKAELCVFCGLCGYKLIREIRVIRGFNALVPLGLSG